MGTEGWSCLIGLERFLQFAQLFHHWNDEGERLAGPCGCVNSHILMTAEQRDGRFLYRRRDMESEFCEHREGGRRDSV